MIKIIVATSKNRVIGKNNSLIWRLPNDLKRFKQITSGSAVVMGRNTYESIGRPLPNRRNIVITRQNINIKGCEVVNSIEQALLLCDRNCFIIGGGEVYKQTIDIADKIYLTLIHEDFEGDSYFPEIDSSWFIISRIDNQPDDKNKHKYSFIEYEKYEL
jgi:dihydrofolate reductase